MSSFLWLGHGHVELCICLGVLGAWLTQHVCLPWGNEAAGGMAFYYLTGPCLLP